MMNLRNSTWTDQKGQTWELSKIIPNHLGNIRAMLSGIISGYRAQPEGSYQSTWELKASLALIDKEIARRKAILDAKPIGFSKSNEIESITSKTIKVMFPAGTSVREMINYLYKFDLGITLDIGLVLNLKEK